MTLVCNFRKLVPLQKGFDEQEPFVSNVLCRDAKPFTRLEPETAAAAGAEGAESLQESRAEADGRLKELMDINQQLYKFSVKHILQSSKS